MSGILRIFVTAVLLLTPACSRQQSDLPPASTTLDSGSPVARAEDSPASESADWAEAPDGTMETEEVQTSPPASNPMIRGLQQTVGGSPILREKNGELQQSLADADRLLRDIKQENRLALQEASRQVLAGPRPVNLVLVVADDLGLGDLGCYGGPREATPHLDQMARDGVRFAEFYAGGPASDASWWCLMTGRYTAHGSQSGPAPLGLTPQDHTLAEVMWKGGYDTAFLGNWCLNGADTDGMPHVHGFDEWTGTLFNEAHVTLYPEVIFNDGVQARVTANSGGKAMLCIDEFYTREVGAYLDRHRTGRPFLLVVAYSVPRCCPAGGLSGAKSSEPLRADAERTAAVAALDQHIGEILAKLKQVGLDRQTAVFVTSDTVREKTSSASADLASPEATLRGAKGELYEGGLRVPLLVRWPGQFAAGTVSHYPAAVWDLLPTFAELGNVARLPKGLDGVPLAPVLRGGTSKRTQRLYWESTGQDSQAVRLGKWKAVRPAGKETLADVELYDLSQDPGESTDMAGEHPEIIQEVVNGRS